VANIRGMKDDPRVHPINLKFGKFNIAIFNLLEAAVEKGTVPIKATPLPARESNAFIVMRGEQELKEVLKAAES
jgi:hypothetical protein